MTRAFLLGIRLALIIQLGQIESLGKIKSNRIKIPKKGMMAQKTTYIPNIGIIAIGLIAFCLFTNDVIISR